MQPLDYSELTQEPVPQDSVTQDYVRYTCFIWMLPVFFITPLALFSLQQWWQLEAVQAWSAFVQGVSWLGFVALAVTGFYRQQKSLIMVGYGILLTSVLLQWQLPPVLLALG